MEIYSAFRWKEIQLPISNGFLAVTRIISKGINIFRFSLDIFCNISHFTYLSTYFHGSRENWVFGQTNETKFNSIT